MPRIVVTDAVTGKVEETLSFGAAVQKVKKRVRERDAAAAAPPPAEARAAREEEAPPLPRKQKLAPPTAQKAAKLSQHAVPAVEAPAARQPKQAKKPKGGDDRPNFAALPVEEQAKCVCALRGAWRAASRRVADCVATQRAVGVVQGGVRRLLPRTRCFCARARRPLAARAQPARAAEGSNARLEGHARASPARRAACRALCARRRRRCAGASLSRASPHVPTVCSRYTPRTFAARAGADSRAA